MMRFTKSPGDTVLQSAEDETTILFTGKNSPPDSVWLPRELGGQNVRVRSHQVTACVCGAEHPSLILVLDEPTGICVAECIIKGFLWFREPLIELRDITSENHEALCDWGECIEPATQERNSKPAGWLPVCAACAKKKRFP